MIDSLAGMEDLMKDPEKMKKMQQEMEEILKDPEKKKQIEQYSNMMQNSVEKLKADPEMKAFFEDIEKNGLEAFKKYEKDERILRKFSEATGGPMGGLGGLGGMGGMPGMGGPQAGAPPAAAAGAAPTHKPGDQVWITGLSKAPELNGKKAMVVPPTAEEQKNLAGTNRLIVRLLDTGDQFAVKPENLKTDAQEVDNMMSGSLEDVSAFNPAVQSEANKLRESGKLEDLQNDPELAPIFKDIKENGMGALEKYWDDEVLMAKISKVLANK